MPGRWQVFGVTTRNVEWTARLTLLLREGSYSGEMAWSWEGGSVGTGLATGAL